MRRKYIPRYAVLLALVLNGMRAAAQEPQYSVRNRWQLSLLTGDEQQNLHWSIAGNSYGQNPNVYSELKWKQTGGPSLHANLQWKASGRWTFFADGSRVFISGGQVSDIDYGGNDRTNITYRQQFGSDKGNTVSWSAGAGYCFVQHRRLCLNVYVGYGINYQSFYLVDHSGMYAALNSSYKTGWSGPLVRPGAVVQLARRLQLTAELQYSQLDYGAKADWNLVQSFSHPVSFRHTAKGYGVDALLGFQYSLCRYISVQVRAGYFNRQTGTGVDQLYLASGQTDKTLLNGVGTDGGYMSGGLSIVF